MHGENAGTSQPHNSRISRRQLLKSGIGISLGSAVTLFSTGNTRAEPNKKEVDSIRQIKNSPWTQQAKLTADDGDSDDHFGDAVSMSGDGSTLIVGANFEEDPNGPKAGSAYVFMNSGGSWTQQAKLTADDGDSTDEFGRIVDMSGDGSTAVVGAPRDDENGEDAGSAYVFTNRDGSWTQQAKLTADDGDSEDLFGNAVSMSGDGSILIVGAQWEEEPNGSKAGSAYVFTNRDGSWTQQAKLTADDGENMDVFGVAMAMSRDGSTALVGAFLDDDDENGEDAGSAYVFTNRDGSWTQQAKLTADDGDSDDLFGVRVSMSGDGSTALIGAVYDEDPNGENAGSAYVFSNSGGSWTQQAKLAAEDGDQEDLFGSSTSMTNDGSTALIGAGWDDDPNGSKAGSAYVFSKGSFPFEPPTETATEPPTETATEPPTETATHTPTQSPTQGATATTGAGGPGFGVVSALAGLGGAGYLFSSRVREANDDD